MKMKNIIKVLLSAGFILSSFYLCAQPAGGPPPEPPPCTPFPQCIPIDGGIGFLIAAGLALGGKKVYDYKKSLKN